MIKTEMSVRILVHLFVCAVILLAGYAPFVFCDDNEPLPNQRREHPFNIGVNLGGPIIVTGFNTSVFALPWLEAEIGADIFNQGFYGGLKYHLLANHPHLMTTPFIGAIYAMVPEGVISDRITSIYYFPIGVRHTINKHWFFSPEAAYLVYPKDNRVKFSNKPSFWFCFKYNYSF